MHSNFTEFSPALNAYIHADSSIADNDGISATTVWQAIYFLNVRCDLIPVLIHTPPTLSMHSCMHALIGQVC